MRTGARLSVDLAALESNYRTLCRQAGPSEVAGVVKADGYGLGVEPVATTLWRAGCRRFFVARLEEGVALRALLGQAAVFVFDGVVPGTVEDLLGSALVPVINSLGQLERWQGAAMKAERELPTALHFDTGMLRLGLTAGDAKTLVAEPSRLEALEVQLVMSHLATADEPSHQQAEHQLERFQRLRQMLPVGGASLANSAGVYRHPAFHFDVVRPGIALYGGHPQPESSRINPMTTVATVEAPVLQVRSAAIGESVGYGATHIIDRPTRLATIGVGYADGFPRSGSNRGAVCYAGSVLPIVGRISMDLVTVDVTDLRTENGADVTEGTMVEVIGNHRTIDDVAADAGTIGYEVLTALGKRYQRSYVGRPADQESDDEFA